MLHFWQVIKLKHLPYSILTINLRNTNLIQGKGNVLHLKPTRLIELNSIRGASFSSFLPRIKIFYEFEPAGCKTNLLNNFITLT